MSSGFDLLLAKEGNNQDWIDLSIGEPKGITDLVKSIHGLESFAFPNEKMWEYPAPNGYTPLVNYLEKKYGAKVVITNGAKQGLAAAFYAFKQKGYKKLGMRLPYWALIPPLVKHYGLDVGFADPSVELPEDIDCYLALAPNNPDGYLPRFETLKQMKEAGIPLIHDAAYYTNLYLPPTGYRAPDLGDLQIFSMSKMYGLSGLRLGYVVCWNNAYYKDLLSYMETFTVGVSTPSQKILLDILEKEERCPELAGIFEKEGRCLLRDAREALKEIPSGIISFPSDYDEQAGMFAWVKLIDDEALVKAKIKGIPGVAFGVPGMLRINLGVGPWKIIEAVNRLNKI